MSEIDARTKLFKESAESDLTDAAREREIKKLKSYLFKNQDCRFSKSAQTYLFMAVMGHYNKCPAPDGPCGGEVASLLDDALKMPFNVFSSSHKSKFLSSYWSMLGKDGEKEGEEGKPTSSKQLTLLDIAEGGQLMLMRDDGGEYDCNPVLCRSDSLMAAVRAAFDAGEEVIVTVVKEGEAAVCVDYRVGTA
ncbi:hypothetical protein AGDE_02919 [Angomonas deanei]|uniref:Eukaryotic elongation factor 5A hypusine, DNA-binding OB fold, putative n=1 Tax=Angomonas deanei TaxID=59799 RepID=A0A7G2C892_9TRYP|nr:hypothetical protein AGDE_02919 [Angomonas deanei]CAD2215665.1 Eukaryotic elongation factor 5A hypusine, DNA-binding OB fold, putative [Angomonas deanei]|eukprot:EPY41006.1 hypothetical protein AGDE_02919 [Angomonas deanei]